MKKYGLFLAILIVFLSPLVLYFFRFHSPLSTEHTRWGEFGSYLSGVYGSLALIIVVYSTFLTRVQFKRENEDSVFFKLFDSLQNRITSSVVKVGEDNLSAHKTLKHIVDKFYEELSKEAVEIARLLLCNSPENLGDTQYLQLFGAIRGGFDNQSILANRSEFIENITSTNDFNIRWETLKCYIGSRGSEPKPVREALQKIGNVYFYKIPYDERKKRYEAALIRVLDEHGEFLDGYFSTLLFVVEFAETTCNMDLYRKYIQSQLTRYEIIIIFYMLTGKKQKLSEVSVFYKSGLLNRLKKSDCTSLMIDMPSPEEIEVELNNLFYEVIKSQIN